MRIVEYPKTRCEAVLEQRAGLSFPDPYRWLEADTDEVRRWQKDQAELASGYVRSWPHYEALKRSIQRFKVPRPTQVPRYAGGRWFRTFVPEGATQAHVVTSDTPNGAGRVLFDPVSERAESPPYVSWISPSPDGRTLAVGVCADASENNTIRLIDVATGRHLPDAPQQVVMDSWSGGAQWLADSSGFFFTGLKGHAHAFEQAVFLHRLGKSAPIEPEPLPIPADSRDWRLVTVSRDGRWAVAAHGMLSPQPVAIRDLSDPRRQWHPFITEKLGTVAGQVFGNCYLAVTNVDAPRGRLVAIDLESSTPNDPSSWREIIPESDATMRTVTRVGDYMYISEYVDTYARVRIFSIDGVLLRTVPLPGKGALLEQPFPYMTLYPQGAADEFVFGFSSLVESWGIYRHRPEQAQLETLIAPEMRLDGAVIEDDWAISADGTRIPYHTVRLASVERHQPQPALLYAYGGYNVAFVPQYPNAMAAFIAAGGTYVHAHLRGGAEYGLDWWRAGSRRNKQRSYEDVYAVARDIVEKGMTASHLLGLTGGSNGGLMAGVAMTQHPEMWKVVVPHVPLLDVIGWCRDPYGLNGFRTDMGDPDNAEDVAFFASLSPYYQVKEGIEYPAVLVDAGDADPRCPPSHARKFAARLQAAYRGNSPMLVHVWEKAGHGWATAEDVQVEQQTEWLAFVMQQLGMQPGAIPR